MLSISERTLWQLTRDGRISAVRFGRTVRYQVPDLLAFVASCRTNETPGDREQQES